MSEHDELNESDIVKPEQTPGELLRAAREQLGLSVDEAANELYMTAYKVRAIENNEFKKLNADAFIRGYLKTYATLVKIDPSQVLAAYDALGISTQASLNIQPKKPSSSKKIMSLLAILAVVLGILWLISVWFLDNRKAQEYKAPVGNTAVSSASSSQVAPTSVIADPADAVAVDTDTDELAVNTLAKQPSSAASLLPTLGQSTLASEATQSSQTSAENHSVSVPTSSVTQVEAEQNTEGATTPQISGGLDKLRLVFSEECWLEIVDANGDVLASDLERASSVREVEGQAPFQVKLGNARAVKMSLNGYDVPIEPRPGTNVRTLKIGR